MLFGYEMDLLWRWRLCVLPHWKEVDALWISRISLTSAYISRHWRLAVIRRTRHVLVLSQAGNLGVRRSDMYTSFERKLVSNKEMWHLNYLLKTPGIRKSNGAKNPSAREKLNCHINFSEVLRIMIYLKILTEQGNWITSLGQLLRVG